MRLMRSRDSNLFKDQRLPLKYENFRPVEAVMGYGPEPIAATAERLEQEFGTTAHDLRLAPGQTPIFSQCQVATARWAAYRPASGRLMDLRKGLFLHFLNYYAFSS